jgi:hypothetical protein
MGPGVVIKTSVLNKLGAIRASPSISTLKSRQRNEGKGKAISLQAWTVPRGRGFQISRQSAHEGAKIVNPTERPPLLPGNILGTHFC